MANKKKNYDETLQIKLSRQQKDMVIALASSYDMSVSQLVRHLINTQTKKILEHEARLIKLPTT